MGKWVALMMATAFMCDTPAAASCTADVAKVEPAITKISDATKKAQAEAEIIEARRAAQQKNEDECTEYLTAAKKAAGIK